MDMKIENIFTIKLNIKEIETLRMFIRSTLAKELPSYNDKSINFRNDFLIMLNHID